MFGKEDLWYKSTVVDWSCICSKSDSNFAIFCQNTHKAEFPVQILNIFNAWYEILFANCKSFNEQYLLESSF